MMLLETAELCNYIQYSRVTQSYSSSDGHYTLLSNLEHSHLSMYHKNNNSLKMVPIIEWFPVALYVQCTGWLHELAHNAILG